MTQMCKARYDLSQSHLDFHSKSNPSAKPYRVYLYRQGENPMCTCMAFLTGRKKAAKAAGLDTNDALFSCTHIKQAMKQVCDWTEHDADKPGFVYDDRCPKCGGPVIDTENFGYVNRTDGVIDVLQLQAELEGRELIIPIADPAGEMFHVILDALNAFSSDGHGPISDAHVGYDAECRLSYPDGYVDAYQRAVVWATRVMDVNLVDEVVAAGEAEPAYLRRRQDVIENQLVKNAPTDQIVESLLKRAT